MASSGDWEPYPRRNRGLEKASQVKTAGRAARPSPPARGVFARRVLRVNRRCRGLIGELQSYVWDAKAALMGVEKPVKQMHGPGEGEPFPNHVVRDDAHHVLHNPVIPVEGVWDAKAALMGVEKPVKQMDHAPDALRYYVNTCLPKWRYGEE